MEGGSATARLAMDVLPVPPLVELTVTELFCTPAATPVTVVEKVHDPLAAKAAPVKVTLLPEAVITPPHVPVTPFAVSPEGNVSVKVMPVKVIVAFELLIVKLRLVVPFSGMLEAPKVLVIEGGPTTVTSSGCVAAAAVGGSHCYEVSLHARRQLR